MSRFPRNWSFQMSGAEKNEKRTLQAVKDERRRAMRAYLEMLEEEEKELAGEAREPETRVLADVTTTFQMSLTDAAVRYLVTCNEPQTAKQIVEGLLAEGRTFDNTNPVHAVRMALRKAMSKNADIFHVEYSKWFLKSRCTVAQLEKYIKKNAKFGTGGHSKKAHIKATSEGIKKRISEGKSWGRAKKATPELLERARELLRGGATLAETSKILGVTPHTLNTEGIHQRALKKEGQQRQTLLELESGDGNVVRFSKS